MNFVVLQENNEIFSCIFRACGLLQSMFDVSFLCSVLDVE